MAAGKHIAENPKRKKRRAALRKAKKALLKWATKKREFSKIFCALAAIVMSRVGVWLIEEYYRLTELAIETGSAAVPDATLPIAGLTAIIAPIVSYLLYQVGLKNSRNKYGVDADGQPFNRIDGQDAPDTPDQPGGTF
ncbi:MAG: hypothetical protein ACI3W5_12735 [Faecousia sp.]